jgi:hypothetical protein
MFRVRVGVELGFRVRVAICHDTRALPIYIRFYRALNSMSIVTLHGCTLFTFFCIPAFATVVEFGALSPPFQEGQKGGKFLVPNGLLYTPMKI